MSEEEKKLPLFNYSYYTNQLNAPNKILGLPSDTFRIVILIIASGVIAVSIFGNKTLIIYISALSFMIYGGAYTASQYDVNFINKIKLFFKNFSPLFKQVLITSKDTNILSKSLIENDFKEKTENFQKSFKNGGMIKKIFLLLKTYILGTLGSIIPDFLHAKTLIINRKTFQPLRNINKFNPIYYLGNRTFEINKPEKINHSFYSYSRGNSKLEGIFCYNLDGTTTIVLKMEGLFINNLNATINSSVFRSKMTIFNNNILDKTVISTYSIRQKIKIDLDDFKHELKYKNYFASLLNENYKKTLKEMSVNKHYIVLTTTPVGRFSKIKEMVNADPLEKLFELATTIIVTLADLKVSFCNIQETVNFMDSIIYNQDLEAKYTEDYKNNLETILNETDVLINKSHVEFPNLTKRKYMNFLTFNNYSEEISERLIYDLFLLNINFTFVQHYDYKDTEKLKHKLKRKRTTESKKSDTDTITAEITGILEELSSGRIKCYDARQQINVFGDTLEEMNDNCDRIKALFNREGYKVDKNTYFAGLYYNSIYPTKRLNNPVNNILTANNICSFNFFANTEKGITKTILGNESLQLIRTTSNSIYNFNFHEGEGNDSAGHTLILGGTGSGKTFFTEFLLSSALKYDGIKIYTFDSYNGLFNFTKLHGGSYQNFKGEVGFDPCDIDLTSKQSRADAKTFLTGFISTMISEESPLTDGEIEQLSNILTEQLKINKNEDQESGFVKFDNIMYNFEMISNANKDLHNLSKKLGEFLPKKKGIASILYPHYYNRNADKNITKMRTLKFDAQVNTFDLENFISNSSSESQKMLSLTTSYILYKISLIKNPMIIFIDEFPKYMKSKEVVNITSKLFSEGRKIKKMMFLAAQTPDQIIKGLPKGLEDPALSSILSNTKKYIIYPTGEMSNQIDIDFYRDNLKLDPHEINWLQTTDPKSRKVMVKTGAETTYLDVNLSQIPRQLFNGLKSDIDAVSKMNDFLNNLSHEINNNKEEAKYISSLNPDQRTEFVVNKFLESNPLD